MISFLKLSLKTSVLLFLLLINAAALFSQTFSNNISTAIPDNSSINIPIVVNGLTNIDTVNFGLQSITLNIQHNADQELTIQLQSPDGTEVLLVNNVPGSNFNNTEFDDTSGIYIDFGGAPYSSTYRAIQDISLINNFQNPNGTWNLVIKDGVAGNAGTFNNVSLQFGNKPARPLLSATNLPIIKLDTHGQDIPDDPKITADMYIIYNGAGQTNYSNQTNYNYAGKIGIEIRGQSSQQFPKKQYGFETRETDGVDDSDVSLLGMPKESDWILSANYSDKSLMRNVLTYEIAREMGQYAPRTIFCELILNNEYRGVFVLEEKIKRDKNRVNVDKIATTDITPPAVTGGYIYSIDKLDGGEVTWDSEIPGSPILYQFVYPKAEDVQPEQQQYLKDYVDSFEEALNGSDYQDPSIGFRKYAEENSFMQYFIINELSRNVDGYRISSYYNKARLGKIIAGPVWDYDIAWGNANYYNGNKTNDYAYSYPIPAGDYQVPFWWAKLRTDPAWEQNMVCLYNNLRQNTLSQTHLNYLIDSFAGVIQDAQQRNFTRWDIIGQYVWPNPTPIPTSFSGEINYLKTWTTQHASFLDGDLGPCNVLPVSFINFYGKAETAFNELTWKTGYEQNGNYFIIERAANDQQFKQIGTVAYSNIANGSYTFNDKTIFNGTAFYRLKEVDKDGRFVYSKIISINTQNAQWHIYPTKVHDQLTIISPDYNGGNITSGIYNTSGQRLSLVSLKNDNVISENVSALSAGIYILEITDEAGNKIHLRFVKD